MADKIVTLYSIAKQKTMDIQSEKLEILQMLLNTNKASVVQKIKRILLSEKTDWWDQISAAEKKEIKEGVQQIKDGETISNEEVLKNPRKWA